MKQLWDYTGRIDDKRLSNFNFERIVLMDNNLFIVPWHMLHIENSSDASIYDLLDTFSLTLFVGNFNLYAVEASKKKNFYLVLPFCFHNIQLILVV